MRILTCILMVGALSAGSLVQAQSLAELAEKEKARRKEQAGTAKVLTEDDLKKSGAKGTFSAPEGQTATAPADGKSKDGKDGDKAQPAGEKAQPDVNLEKSWREKVKQTQEAIVKLNESIQRFQASLGDVSQNLYGGTRATAAAKLEEAQNSLASAQATLAQLQEEGRRNGWN